MTIPVIRAVQWGTPGAPLLLLGPSLGTTADSLWAVAAEHLAHRFHILAWDLPGHGRSPAPTAPFSMGELADAVVGLADEAASGAENFITVCPHTARTPASAAALATSSS